MELSDSLIRYLSQELGVPASRLSAETRLSEDLGVAGDDGDELIYGFGQHFGVDLSGFDVSRHFGSEGCNPFGWIWWIVSRRWPKLVPIALGDLENSIRQGRWVAPSDDAV